MIGGRSCDYGAIFSPSSGTQRFPLRVFGLNLGSGFSLGGVRGASGQSMRSTCNRSPRHPCILPDDRRDKQSAVSTLRIIEGRFLGHPEATTFTGIAGRRKPRHVEAPSGFINFLT
jgi:hypothetical protein